MAWLHEGLFSSTCKSRKPCHNTTSLEPGATCNASWKRALCKHLTAQPAQGRLQRHSVGHAQTGAQAAQVDPCALIVGRLPDHAARVCQLLLKQLFTVSPTQDNHLCLLRRDGAKVDTGYGMQYACCRTKQQPSGHCTILTSGSAQTKSSLRRATLASSPRKPY